MKSRTPNLKGILYTFQSKNYRLYFFGQGLSLMGNWMTNVAVIWLVYQLTDSALLLGVIAFLSQAPSLFLTPWTGFWVDRWERHRILIVTQSIAMLRALALTILAFMGNIEMWQLALLAFIQGLLDALDLPTRQALVPELIERKETLGNAIALNSSLTSASRLLGPAIAGFVITIAGIKACFLIDSLSYIAIIAALLAMKIPKRIKAYRVPLTWTELRAGLTYVTRSSAIRSILLVLGWMSFLGTPYIALGPVFAQDFLAGGSDTFGLLMMASGVGALMGALYLGSRHGIAGLERLILICPFALGLCLGVFALSRNFEVSMVAIALIGCLLVLQTAASNTILQTILDDQLRGRVMGLFAIASVGMVPLGNLFAGGIAGIVGAPTTLLVEGICCSIGSLFLIPHRSILRQLLRV